MLPISSTSAAMTCSCTCSRPCSPRRTERSISRPHRRPRRSRPDERQRRRHREAHRSLDALPDAAYALRARAEAIVEFGAPLSPSDLARPIVRSDVHRRRPDRSSPLTAICGRLSASRYPTFRDLLLADDPNGVKEHWPRRQTSSRWRCTPGTIVPVVGDVSDAGARRSAGGRRAPRTVSLSHFQRRVHRCDESHGRFPQPAPAPRRSERRHPIGLRRRLEHLPAAPIS